MVNSDWQIEREPVAGVAPCLSSHARPSFWGKSGSPEMLTMVFHHRYLEMLTAGSLPGFLQLCEGD